MPPTSARAVRACRTTLAVGLWGLEEGEEVVAPLPTPLTHNPPRGGTASTGQDRRRPCLRHGRTRLTVRVTVILGMRTEGWTVWVGRVAPLPRTPAPTGGLCRRRDLRIRERILVCPPYEALEALVTLRLATVWVVLRRKVHCTALRLKGWRVAGLRLSPALTPPGAASVRQCPILWIGVGVIVVVGVKGMGRAGHGRWTVMVGLEGPALHLPPPTIINPLLTTTLRTVPRRLPSLGRCLERPHPRHTTLHPPRSSGHPRPSGHPHPLSKPRPTKGQTSFSTSR